MLETMHSDICDWSVRSDSDRGGIGMEGGGSVVSHGVAE